MSSAWTSRAADPRLRGEDITNDVAPTDEIG